MFWATRAMSCPTVLPKGKHTATVIFLHGLGDTGHGWLAALEEISQPFVKYMCPNAPTAAVTLNGGMRMPSWFDIKSLSFDEKEDEEGVKRSSESLNSMIEEEIKLGISSERIVIGGFSQGGSVALHTFQTSELKLGGVIGLSTFLSMHKKFDSLCKPTNKDTKVFLGHGNADPVVNYAFGKMTSTVMSKYYKNTKFNTYNGLGHSSHPGEMKDVKEFLSKVLLKQ